IIFFIFLLLIGQPIEATSVEEDDTDYTIMEDVSLHGIENYWNELVDEYEGYIPELEKTTIYEFIKNEEAFSIKNILIGFLEYFFHEFILNTKLLGQLMILTLFSVLLQTIHSAFDKSAVSKIAYFIVYIVLLFISLNSFYLASNYIKDAIDMMTNFMIALIPLVLGIMSTFGNLISVSFFHPVSIFLINIS